MSQRHSDVRNKNTEYTEQARNSQNFEEYSELSHRIIGACIEVQQQLGPGLLENAYANALAIELQTQRISFEREFPIDAHYKTKPLGIAYRADFLVDQVILLEIKAVETLTDLHKAQLLTYLRLSQRRFGLLLNFHAMPIAREGIRRVLNGY
jgi:GxxExxY protein